MHGDRPRGAVVDAVAWVGQQVEVDADHQAQPACGIGGGRAFHVHGIDFTARQVFKPRP
ncbi:hypothetical protein D3C79_1118640 [compost metagenome]